jgi:pimeloyl-ACP methyl ester carboxylesterase
MDEKIFAGREARLNYAESLTNGPPLLLLHGSTFRWQSFSSLIPELSRRYKVYALDFRGHGKSSHDFAKYRYQDLVNDTVEFVIECIGKPTSILGHSLGAAVGFAAAARLGAMTQSLIIADNFLYHDSLVEITAQPLLRSMLRAVQRIAGLGQTPSQVLGLLVDTKLPLGDSEITVGELFEGKSTFLAAWAESIAQLDPKVVEIFFTALQPEEYDGEAWLNQINCPILLLQANPGLGGILPDRDVERVLSIRPNTTVHRFESLGHMMHMENPEPVIPIVQAFLDSRSETP